MTHFDKLVEAVLKYGSIVEEPSFKPNAKGVMYRYVVYDVFKFTPTWLKTLFERASEEVNEGRRYRNQIAQGKHALFFNRAVYKGQPDGKISMRVLEIQEG